MAEFGRIFWLWFMHNQRPVPKTREQWLGTLLTLCITGFLLQVLSVVAPSSSRLVLFGVAVLTAGSVIMNRFDKGLLVWSACSVAAAVVPFYVAILLSPPILGLGVMVFDTTGGKSYTTAVEQMQNTGKDTGFAKTLIPGPLLSYAWLWYGNGLDWWLVAPAAGFLFSSVCIFRQKFMNWWDSNEDPLNPA